MQKIIIFFMSLIILFSSSCANDKVTLSEKYLLQPENIFKIIIEGDESSLSSGVSLKITNKLIIKEIVSKMNVPQGKKQKIYSGYRQVLIFKSGYSDLPSVTLLINESDVVHVKDDKLEYICEGLHAYIMKLLQPTSDEVQRLLKEREGK